MKESPELTERIGAYVSGNMTPSEIMQFEQEIAVDVALQKEVELQRQLHNFLSKKGALAYRKRVQEIRTEMLEQPSPLKAKKQHTSGYWKIAATIVVLLSLGLGVWRFQDHAEGRNDVVFKQYYTPFPAEDEKRGELVEEEVIQLTKLYRNGYYQDVINFYKNTSEIALDPLEQLYVGNSYLQLSQSVAALKILQQIPESSPYYEDGLWYQALCYLKQDDNMQTKKVLQSLIMYDGRYKDQAEELKEALE